MPRQKRLWSMIATCIVSLLSINTFAAIPGADNPKTYTEHDYRQQLLEFNHRTIVDAYQQFGHHDPKWDDAAKQFLEAMTVYVSNIGADPIYQLPNPQLPIEQLESLGRQVIAAKCDDPLVMYLFCPLFFTTAAMFMSWKKHSARRSIHWPRATTPLIKLRWPSAWR